MSNSIINIRFLSWHLQWDRGAWHPVVSFNGYHRENNWPDGFFSVYDFPGIR
ncbi:MULTISPECIES: hypothetical protein [unclassified Stenotrophomonas maltophilia group]|uniref:hypothetical protein n=1 Tax=unclassified Stenotrophomonas maltophilia group TaxID=2961925 RepID=UPI003BF80508